MGTSIEVSCNQGRDKYSRKHLLGCVVASFIMVDSAVDARDVSCCSGCEQNLFVVISPMTEGRTFRDNEHGLYRGFYVRCPPSIISGGSGKWRFYYGVKIAKFLLCRTFLYP